MTRIVRCHACHRRIGWTTSLELLDRVRVLLREASLWEPFFTTAFYPGKTVERALRDARIETWANLMIMDEAGRLQELPGVGPATEERIRWDLDRAWDDALWHVGIELVNCDDHDRVENGEVER